MECFPHDWYLEPNHYTPSNFHETVQGVNKVSDIRILVKGILCCLCKFFKRLSLVKRKFNE